ncbi:MAG: glycosyltransferase family 39 protein [Chloroflexi bacterium]|nr:glycosyltransferase family 39 protein [Chloroflexota bacterium]
MGSTQILDRLKALLIRFSRYRWIPVAAVCLGIFVANFLVQIGTNPSYQRMNVDSGVFAYCGQQILNGALLYRDCYDNKPPAVYYVDAAAISLTGPNTGGIWLFQGVWMAVVGIFFFLILCKIWGFIPAMLSAGILLFTALFPDYYQNGNITESYVLLPLVLLIGALYAYLKTEKHRYLVAIGLLTAAAFLFKPTYISLGACSGLAVVIYDLRHDGSHSAFRRAAGHTALMAASGAIPLLLVAAYWAARGGFGDLWFAVFTHNSQYVQGGFSFTLLKQTLLKFLQVQPLAAPFGFWLAAVGVFAVKSWREFRLNRRIGKYQGSANPSSMTQGHIARWYLMLAVLLSVPIEIIFITISGKDFGHYYLLPIPALAASSGYLFFEVRRSLRKRPGAALAACAVVAVMALPWAYQVVSVERPRPAELLSFWENPAITTHTMDELEQYVVDHSQPSQSVLVWSNHPSINLLTKRHSPTRYVFPVHLFSPTPTGSTGFAEFLGELAKDPPELILAQKESSVGLPSFWAEDTDICPDCSAEARQGMLAFKQYTEAHYEFATQIWDWYIYQRVN